MKMITVGFVSRYPPVHCGIAEYTKFLISALRSLNPKLKIYVFSTYEAYKDSYEDELGVNILPCFEPSEKSYSDFLSQLAEVGGVDILHVQHEYGIFGEGKHVLNALARAKEEELVKKTVITMHTVDHPYGRDYALRFQSSLNDVDAVIVHSNLQEFELQMQNIDTSKLFRIPHGTLINPYLSYTKGFLSKSLGLNEDDFRGIILAIPGFLRKDKGVDVLLEALKLIEDIRFTILLAGEPRDPELHELVTKKTEYRTIVIERYLSGDEILRVVALADAIVLPYKDRKGAYAVSGILHLSMGGLKPIIGSRTPRLIELYQFAPDMTVPPNDPKELANKIRWLVDNYDYAVAYMTELYGYAARTQWIRMAYRHLRLYRSLLN